MNDTRDYTNPILDSILHPTDFTEGSRVAFHHALKAALLAQSKLTLFHVSPDEDEEWADFPGVRDTLERWGLLPAGSPRAAVPQIGIDVRKVIAQHTNPVKAVLRYLDAHAADLIVLATHQHEGRAHWLRHSVAEPVARRAAQMTLFIPGGCAGFVSADGWRRVVGTHSHSGGGRAAVAAGHRGSRPTGGSPELPARDVHAAACRRSGQDASGSLSSCSRLGVEQTHA